MPENPKKKKEIPIHEKLSPGEFYIISKDVEGKCLEVVENNNGKLKVRKICTDEE